jgi:hypothetical protein
MARMSPALPAELRPFPFMCFVPLSSDRDPGLEFIGWRLVVTGFTTSAVKPETTNPKPYSPEPGFRIRVRGTSSYYGATMQLYSHARPLPHLRREVSGAPRARRRATRRSELTNEASGSRTRNRPADNRMLYRLSYSPSVARRRRDVTEDAPSSGSRVPVLEHHATPADGEPRCWCCCAAFFPDHRLSISVVRALRMRLGAGSGPSIHR